MASPFEDLARLDHLVHEPARLAIMTALAACRGANFLFLQSITGLSAGNLSGHLSKLEAAGLVRIDKQFVRKVPRTEVFLTATGRQAIERHWHALEQLRAKAKTWCAENSE
jgi:DNA-binding transcriptional ArsR family regulator